MKICKNCGAEIEDDAMLCPDCGKTPDETVIDEAEAPVEETVEEEAATEEVDLSTAEEEAEVEVEAEEEPKKKGWTKVTTIIVIVAGVIILALVGYILYETGPLKDLYESIRPKTQSSCTMEDYSTIPISSADVEITDEDVEEYISDELGDDPTDEDVQEYAATVDDCDAETLEEFEEYVENYLYKNALHTAMMDYLTSITTVNSYDEEDEQMLIDYNAEELEYYASYYGYDADTLASMYGYDTAVEYETETAHQYMTAVMILDKVASDNNITVTDDEVNESLQEYLDESGYSSMYTIDEFKEYAGDAWFYLYQNLTCKYSKCMEALEPRVEISEE